jgi:hypothetical protein
MPELLREELPVGPGTPLAVTIAGPRPPLAPATKPMG